MQFKPKLLLFILLLFAGTEVRAQAGSLGDPVFTFDFGSGNTPKFPPATGYQYVTGSCPNDGQYAISKTETGCHDDTWHQVLKDHTGNDGYMMVVNANEVQGQKFFEYTLNPNTLCENTEYEFSAYILNLIKAGQSGFNRPNVSFVIEKPDGTPIGIAEGVEIPETSDPSGWVKYSRRFTAGAGVTSVRIKMINNAPGGPGNDLLLDDIAFRAYGPIVQTGIPNDAGEISTIPGNQCVGISKRYIIKSSPINDTYKYQWQQNLNGAGWTDITTPPETTPTLIRDFPATQPAGSYQYRLGVAVGDNITSESCRVYSNTFTINVNALPPVPVPSTQTVCEGGTFTLTGSGGVTYKWTGPNNLSVTSPDPVTIPAIKANEGRYNVEVISMANCSSFSYVDVTVNLKPIIDMEEIQPACKGVGVPLKVSVHEPGTDTYTYSWFPTGDLTNANAADLTANPNITTDYTVTVTNNRTTCSDTRQVHVEILDVPVANAGSDKKIFEGQLVMLDGGEAGDVTYSWSPTEYLDNPHSRTPTAKPPHTTPYVLTVTPANGCSIDVDEMIVTVYEKIVVPSTFTPNNDGVNDIWNIEALETYPDGVISVFTRNGKQVFQSRGYGKPWDGKFNGSLLPAGTYYYVIDLKNNTPKLSGWVLLVR
nr:gliding motility-associated C-terminal domain-containing protein [Mucilaginibacter sp. L294]